MTVSEMGLDQSRRHDRRSSERGNGGGRRARRAVRADAYAVLKAPRGLWVMLQMTSRESK